MVDAPSAESSTTASCARKDVRAQLGVVIAGTHVGRRSVGLGPKLREAGIRPVRVKEFAKRCDLCSSSTPACRPRPRRT
jgi:hypothetical protein